MTEIGILSDTHGYLHPDFLNNVRGCREIWHAGDIGDNAIAEKISSQYHLRAVYGNIDGPSIRAQFPEIEFFTIEGLQVLMLHIGGYPTKYSKQARELISKYKPGLFVCGHSHILKVMHDPKNDLLMINPGAAGRSGFHQHITWVKIKIEQGKLSELQLVEYPK